MFLCPSHVGLVSPPLLLSCLPSSCTPAAPQHLYELMGQKQVISDGLMVMTGVRQEEWSNGVIEQCVLVSVFIRVCVCVGERWCKSQPFPWQQLSTGRFQVELNQHAKMKESQTRGAGGLITICPPSPLECVFVCFILFFFYYILQL